MYSAWIKINETLPWIEIEGTYKTKGEARKAAKETIKEMKIKIVQLPDRETLVKTLVPMKASTGKR